MPPAMKNVGIKFALVFVHVDVRVCGECQGAGCVWAVSKVEDVCGV